MKYFRFSANLKLRPGRWYKFRIAAINENGTRGYSENSHVFQLKERKALSIQF